MSVNAIIPANSELPTIPRGDTFPGMTINLETTDPDGVVTGYWDLTGHSINMHIRTSPESAKIIKAFSVGSGITITAPALGQFEIDKFLVLLPPATYNYDIEVIAPNGDVRTVLEGTWEILQDVTRV